MKYKEIKADIKSRLKPARFEHTMGVVESAKHLAEIHGCNVKKARYAALMHDCAKYMDDDTKIALCAKYGVPISEAELKAPTLLHAKCGAILAKYRYGIDDEKILHAIAVHTTGVPDMNKLDKIIFISDYIEPNRDVAPHLDELRELADHDMNATVYRILEDTVSYLNSRRTQTTDPTTIKAYEYYRKKVKGD